MLLTPPPPYRGPRPDNRRAADAILEPPPIVPLNVLSVTRLSGTSVRVLFDGDPHVAPGMAGAEFYVNGSGFPVRGS